MLSLLYKYLALINFRFLFFIWIIPTIFKDYKIMALFFLCITSFISIGVDIFFYKPNNKFFFNLVHNSIFTFISTLNLFTFISDTFWKVEIEPFENLLVKRYNFNTFMTYFLIYIFINVIPNLNLFSYILAGINTSVLLINTPL